MHIVNNPSPVYFDSWVNQCSCDRLWLQMADGVSLCLPFLYLFMPERGGESDKQRERKVIGREIDYIRYQSSDPLWHGWEYQCWIPSLCSTPHVCVQRCLESIWSRVDPCLAPHSRRRRVGRGGSCREECLMFGVTSLRVRVLECGCFMRSLCRMSTCAFDCVCQCMCAHM